MAGKKISVEKVFANYTKFLIFPVFFLSLLRNSTFGGDPDNLVSCNPASSHEELKYDFPIVLVQTVGIEGLRGLTLLLLQVVRQQARLVADVVGGCKAQVGAKLSLIHREYFVTRKTNYCTHLKRKHTH